ncbi:HAMP domain-containing protein [Rhodobacter capsulatus]|uniref:ATP-binding protein n=1 Tax=Rhodobacter capsulatus TaxID=1061 RepID=UPI0006DCB563|nr:ATP-binding protein [Rhodobacter capsulatus]KQB15173.1 histidine kinase [Rhodobacter capsulatus]KQB16890.1 histidine kinase [Rhodobacter capsulatus]PZX23680.1 two-component system osmolarity sensor histidine kinase EnvZ [Rhodobacter capsulatus]QNR62365.1 HAMP domain-containing protein [Rhodobacter capsulatus]
MDFAWLKHFLPRGLYGRAALILILPVVTIQLVVSVVFIQRHFERVTEQMTTSMLREIALVVERAETAETGAKAATRMAELAQALDLRLELPAPRPVPATDRREITDFTGLTVQSTLRAGLPGMIALDLTAGGRVQLWVATRHGPLYIGFPRIWVSAANPHQLLVLMVFVSVLMTLIAFLFLRNQLRPIQRLARAAEAFGKGQIAPYRPTGALEVRAAGKAFLEMRDRIERQTESRRLMLSGISHDLRTPLTRLRLGLSMLPEEPETEAEIAAMARDVTEMGKMIDAFLNVAREEAMAGEPEPVEICAFVAQVVEDAVRAGQPVQLVACPEAPVQTVLRPDALRRALENLIGNAVRYGTRAEVSVTVRPRSLRLLVEDDGPGIPAERREEAMRPFTRLDPARNQDRGQGVGLGLAIAADIARGHGGSLSLLEGKRLGGLAAELILPL